MVFSNQPKQGRESKDFTWLRRGESLGKRYLISENWSRFQTGKLDGCEAGGFRTDAKLCACRETPLREQGAMEK